MINAIIIQGNLTEKSVLNTSAKGITYTCFTIACNQGYGANKKTDFIRCTAFGQTAQFICKYFDKGSQIAIEGSLHNNDYTDKNGVKHYSMNVTVNQVHFCGAKSAETNIVASKEENLSLASDGGIIL